MLRVIQSSVVALSLILVSGAEARIHNFVVPLSGTQEVSGGDPDGTGTAHLSINDETSPPTISWKMVVSNLEPTISGVHIHVGGTGVNGSVVVPFTGNQLVGNSLQDADLTAVLANPAGYYVNIHTTPTHGAGAIRGQMGPPSSVVPSVTAYGLAALAVLLAAGAVMVFKKRQPVLAS